MIPLHSAIARLDKNPIRPAKIVGIMKGVRGSPEEASVYAKPAKGRTIMKIALLTRCEVHVTCFSKVPLSVRGGWRLSRLKIDAFWNGIANKAPSGMAKTHNPTYCGLKR